MNGGKTFVDTNVLVYLFDENAPEKQEIAQRRVAELVADDHLLLSTQVLQEFYVAVTRKLEKPLSEDEAQEAVRQLVINPVVGIDTALVLGAIDLSRQHRLSLWDALILKAALDSGCHVLLTEDLQHGWEIQGLRVENPFRGVGKIEN
jgi:predicted nucleic acid-binding protein